MMRMVNAHTPALLPGEAALLPAMTGSGRNRRANLYWPDEPTHFLSVNREAAVRDNPVSAPVPDRRGSMAGRAIFTAAGVNLPGVETPRTSRKRRMVITALNAQAQRAERNSESELTEY